MTIPETMHALILEEPGRMSLQSITVPAPAPGEVLLQVKSATTCGTDLKAFLRGHPQIPMPGPFGHEYSGVVVATGTGATFSVGDAVMGVHSAPCQSCFWCLHGQENLCESIMATKVLGSYADFLLVPERIARLNLFLKPQSLTFDQASLLEPLACVAQGILELRKTGVLDDIGNVSVLIIGPGAIGLMFVAALRLLGCRHVTLGGRNEARLAVGASLGADAVKLHRVQPLDGRGYDVVIECTGQVEVWESSVDFVRRGGHVMLFGGCKGGTSAAFDTRRLHYDQITLLSPFHFGTSAVRVARDWLLDPRMDLRGLVTGCAVLSEGQRVFDELQSGHGIKVAFRP